VDRVIFAADLIAYDMHLLELPSQMDIYERRVLKWITQGDLLRFALVNLLVFASLKTKKQNKKKADLNQLKPDANLDVDCVAHYGNDPAVFVFFNLSGVSVVQEHFCQFFFFETVDCNQFEVWTLRAPKSSAATSTSLTQIHVKQTWHSYRSTQLHHRGSEDSCAGRTVLPTGLLSPHTW